MEATHSPKKIDKVFLFLTFVLLFVGIITFVSASLSVLAENEPLFYKMIFTQLGLGLVLGGISMFVISQIHYEFWKKWWIPISIFSLILVLLLFVPGIRLEHGGAIRWVDFGFISFQPSEILKFGSIIFLATLFSQIKRKVNTFVGGLLPFIGTIVVIGALLLWQPDTGTFLVTITSLVGIYFVAGARWRDIFILLILAVFGLVALVSARPYLLDRIKTYSDPSQDVFGSSWQITQSTIAIGSGKVFGRGLGQSVQKFEYLPEQTGDSIFAIYAEELGFVGSAVFVILLVLFSLRGIRIAKLAPDMFSRLLAIGIVILITAQSFVNIAAIVGIIPLTGLPLVFMSHGGTALFVMLSGIGIVLNISKYKSRFKKKLV